MTGDTRVVYTKYDGSLHWHKRMHRLGEDAYGVWLGARAGLIEQKGHDGPLVELGFDHVILCPHEGWYTAAFNAPSATHQTEIYCDITTPVQWPSTGEVTMVDLDLDVIRLRPDGRVILDDEDEFAEHQVRYAYPAEVIASAAEAAAWLMAEVTARREPFDQVGPAWLTRLP
ncbi:DUF402 domain-containing protein [Hamadaea tsunoensis]|uniref:DUF402 domain-containing protein n=1 Tax=Hamadaea tsunoensis TaxID=53368 RepID=UPI0004846938|nr:DUF402 domain-containing protein [Hamadaea tsunoensis]